MDYAEQQLVEFTEVLASKAAIPGGGGAASLVGAVGSALASMVANITVGKVEDEDARREIENVIAEGEQTRLELLELIDADAEAFEPLSKAYGIPRDNPDRAAILENALHDACGTPLQIMRTCCKAIDANECMSRLGAGTVISDVGVGVKCAKAALEGASLNVFINTKLMKDRERAESFEQEAQRMLDEYLPKADAVYDATLKRIRG